MTMTNVLCLLRLEELSDSPQTFLNFFFYISSEYLEFGVIPS
jgi:hypothetical protein